MKLNKNIDFPEPFWLRAWVTDRTKQLPRIVRRSIPVFLPHEIVAWMHDKHPQLFRDILTGPEGALEEYWKGISPEDPRFANHPLRSFEDWQILCLPLRVHADGVPPLP